MKGFIALFLVVALLVSFCFSFRGCERTPVEGIVTAKEWVPSHDDQQFINVYQPDGSFIMVPTWTHYDEEWRIYVGSRYARVSKGKFKTIEIQSYFKEEPRRHPQHPQE